MVVDGQHRQHQVAFATTPDNLKAASSGHTALTDETTDVTSFRSNASSNGSSSGAKSTSLGSNLMRQHLDRDPFARYERLKTLGEGSMGSVCLVRKYAHTVGGSARIDAHARAAVQKKYDECFQLPIIGGCFAWILQDKAKADIEEAGKQDARDILWAVENASGSNNSNNDKVYAMKSIHYNLIRDKIFVDELRNEVAQLRSLDHPHIVKVHSTYDYHKQLYVVMEACSGGDLYARDPYTEAEAARIITAILSALRYMHGKGVIHRDLKYENVLFVNQLPQAEVKLIDFGLSKEIKEHEKLDEGAGTIYTMAPEVLKGCYSKEADLWSLGVMAFMLLSSQMPFFGTTRREVAGNILKGEFKFKGRRWRKTSNQAKAFVEDLLVLDAEDRATADEALMSSWLHVSRATATVRNPHKGELKYVKETIQKYVKYPRLRKLALMVIAHRSSSEEIGILRKVFQHYDTNHSGTLDFDSFKGALLDAGFSDEDYSGIFDAVDVDGTGTIRYTEFLAATIEAAGWISEERLAIAFDRLDHDDTGFISKQNLRDLLGSAFPEEEIDAMIKEAASSEQGITFADFLAQWNTDKNEFMREWSQHMVPESIDADVPRKVSDYSFSDDYRDVDESARSNFLDGKEVSVRKMAISA